MFPSFPSLMPSIVNPLWFDVDRPRDDEAEVVQLESELQEKQFLVTQIAADMTPLGKFGLENQDCPDSDDDDGNTDNTDDTESHDEEDEEEMAAAVNDTLETI